MFMYSTFLKGRIKGFCPILKQAIRDALNMYESESISYVYDRLGNTTLNIIENIRAIFS